MPSAGTPSRLVAAPRRHRVLPKVRASDPEARLGDVQGAHAIMSIARLFCWLFGHRDPELDRRTMKVRCHHCGFVSRGIDLAHHLVKGEEVETARAEVKFSKPDWRTRMANPRLPAAKAKNVLRMRGKS